MFKLITVLILAGVAIMWLRIQASNLKAKNASKKILNDLRKGNIDFTSLADSLGMMIRSKSMSPAFNAFSFNQRMDNLTTGKLLDKFTISHIERSPANNSIVIAEAVVKDIIPSSGNNRQVDVVYPCWILIKLDNPEQKIDFTSSMPQDREHQYLLEDLSDEIYKQCTV